MTKLMVETRKGNLPGSGGFHDFLMVNLAWTGGFKVRVSGRIDLLSPWDSNLRPTHQRLQWPSVCMVASLYIKKLIMQTVHIIQLDGGDTDSLPKGDFCKATLIYFLITLSGSVVPSHLSTKGGGIRSNGGGMCTNGGGIRTNGGGMGTNKGGIHSFLLCLYLRTTSVTRTRHVLDGAKR